MGSSVNYRVRDILGYTETDVFNIYTWGSNKKRGLKFRVYYNILAAFLGQNISREDILKMLPKVVRDNARNGYVDDPAEWYVEGYFTSNHEIDHFLVAIETEMQVSTKIWTK
jgi:hypothetical protein